jgi:anti-anti-sigma regulatory factor
MVVPMPMIAEWIKIDEECVAHGLQQTREKLQASGSEVVLDFSSVHRIDASAIRELEALSEIADRKTLRVGLRGVNVEIYKVLKLVRLAPRFSFLN